MSVLQKSAFVLASLVIAGSSLAHSIEIEFLDDHSALATGLTPNSTVVWSVVLRVYRAPSWTEVQKIREVRLSDGAGQSLIQWVDPKGLWEADRFPISLWAVLDSATLRFDARRANVETTSLRPAYVVNDGQALDLGHFPRAASAWARGDRGWFANAYDGDPADGDGETNDILFLTPAAFAREEYNHDVPERFDLEQDLVVSISPVNLRVVYSAPPLFADDFEDGSLSAWSSRAPLP